ncbi:MAG TPA: sulfite exporter TauE/SafE family protein [Flavobacteriaceae bacterium]|nr:sulfite exporter TauE/SafE family protein [Flavobacteriaceae bacterium]
MEITQILGYLSALLIGVVLGLIGGGGSILTIPILVYLMRIEPVVATAYSLFVVGITSTVGSIKNIHKGLVDFKTVFVFAIPAFLSVYATRRFIIPAIPTSLFEINGFMVTKNIAIMVFFAVMMLLASLTMIRNKRPESDLVPKTNYPLLVVLAVITGLLTGLVGAGGGFIIIPILVLFAKLPMKNAVATSLVIIMINSLIGFTGDIENMDIDWEFLLPFSILPIIGIFIGIWLHRFIDGKKLKKSFGWFVFLMSIYIIFKESSF